MSYDFTKDWPCREAARALDKMLAKMISECDPPLTPDELSHVEIRMIQARQTPSSYSATIGLYVRGRRRL